MGARLQAIREALGLTQEDMAANMGVVTTTLSAWESGRNQIDIVKLAKSAARWGFTTDWIARGDLSGLRKDLADKIEAIIARGPASRRGRPPARHEMPVAGPLAGEFIDRPDELAWVAFWRGLNDAGRAEALRMLRVPENVRARA